MAGSSKSSQKGKNIALALLAIWSIVSLVVIVVWATSPDLKSSTQLRTELQETREKLEGAKVLHQKNQEALEERVRRAEDEQERQRQHGLLLLGLLNATNATLDECRADKVILMGNISALEEQVEELRQTEANLTTLLGLKEDHIDILQQNLTEALLHTNTCYSLKAAAESQMQAAQSQTLACESRQQYAQKQLQKCKADAAETKAPPQRQTEPVAPPTDGAPSLLTAVPTLALLVSCGLHLLT